MSSWLANVYIPPTPPPKPSLKTFKSPLLPDGVIPIRDSSKLGQSMEDEPVTTLWDGYSTRYVDGIMDFTLPEKDFDRVPPDVRAYYALVYRWSQGDYDHLGYFDLHPCIFRPITEQEVRKGAAYLERERLANRRGLFIDPEMYRDKTVPDSTTVHVWQHLGNDWREEFHRAESSFGKVYTLVPSGTPPYVIPHIIKTNVRAPFFSWSTGFPAELLQLYVAWAYHDSYNPFLYLLLESAGDKSSFSEMNFMELFDEFPEDVFEELLYPLYRIDLMPNHIRTMWFDPDEQWDSDVEKDSTVEKIIDEYYKDRERKEKEAEVLKDQDENKPETKDKEDIL